MDDFRIGAEPGVIGPFASPHHGDHGWSVIGMMQFIAHIKPIIFDGRNFRSIEPSAQIAQGAITRGFAQQQQSEPGIHRLTGGFIVVPVAEPGVSTGPGVTGIGIETPKKWKHGIGAVRTSDVPHEQLEHGRPLFRPTGIAAR